MTTVRLMRKINTILLLLCLVALWLDHSKTLRQQDIDEQSIVVLRRKYFFSDTNIDQRDPVQLNLLYIQVNSTKITNSYTFFLLFSSVEMVFSTAHIP